MRPGKLVLLVLALAALGLAGTPPLRAQENPADADKTREVRRMVHDTSRALQARNPSMFLRLFDREKFAGYAVLESHIVALTTQSDIASSIEIVEIEQKETGYRLRVDWLLQLSVQETPGPLETRRQVLEISAAEQKKGRWRITDLNPVEFFQPQGASQPPQH